MRGGSRRITLRVPEELHARLSDAAVQQGADVSAFVRQVLVAALEGPSDTPTSVPSHMPEDCLAVLLGQASPRVQRHLAEVFARLDGILTRQGHSRLWFVAETLACWVDVVAQRLTDSAARGTPPPRPTTP